MNLRFPINACILIKLSRSLLSRSTTLAAKQTKALHLLWKRVEKCRTKQLFELKYKPRQIVADLFPPIVGTPKGKPLVSRLQQSHYARMETRKIRIYRTLSERSAVTLYTDQSRADTELTKRDKARTPIDYQPRFAFAKSILNTHSSEKVR